MKARLALLVTLAVALAGAREAHAQAEAPQWLSDRKYREGMGIRVGDFELHPGIGAEFGFDSNYFRRASSPDEDPIGSLQLRLSPSFSVSTLGPQRREDGPAPTVEFRFGTHASYYEFFPVTGSEGGKLRLQEQRNIDLRADTQVGLLPGRRRNRCRASTIVFCPC